MFTKNVIFSAYVVEFSISNTVSLQVGKTAHKNEWHLYLVTYIFAKLSQNVYLISIQN